MSKAAMLAQARRGSQAQAYGPRGGAGHEHKSHKGKPPMRTLRSRQNAICSVLAAHDYVRRTTTYRQLHRIVCNLDTCLDKPSAYLRRFRCCELPELMPGLRVYRIHATTATIHYEAWNASEDVVVHDKTFPWILFVLRDQLFPRSKSRYSRLRLRESHLSMRKLLTTFLPRRTCSIRQQRQSSVTRVWHNMLSAHSRLTLYRLRAPQGLMCSAKHRSNGKHKSTPKCFLG